MGTEAIELVRWRAKYKLSPYRNLRAVISLRASIRRFSCGGDDDVRTPCFVGRSPRPRSLNAPSACVLLVRLEEAGEAEKVAAVARGDLGVYVFVAPPPRRVDLGDAAVCGRRRGESGIANSVKMSSRAVSFLRLSPHSSPA